MTCKKIFLPIAIITFLSFPLNAMDDSSSSNNSPRILAGSGNNSPRKLSLSSPRVAGIVRSGSASNVALANAVLRKKTGSDEIKRNSARRSMSGVLSQKASNDVGKKLDEVNQKLKDLASSRRPSNSPCETDEATLVQLAHGEEPTSDDINIKLRHSLDLKKELASIALDDERTNEHMQGREN